MDPWWKPERRGRVTVDAVGGSVLKGGAGKNFNKVRKVFEVLLRIRIHPSRYRVGAKRLDYRANGIISIGCFDILNCNHFLVSVWVREHHEGHEDHEVTRTFRVGLDCAFQ